MSTTTPFSPDPTRRAADEQAARAEFLTAHPAEAFLADVELRRAQRWRTGARPFAVGLATAGLALAIVVGGLFPSEHGVRSKGTAPAGASGAANDPAALQFAVKREADVLKGTPGLVCHAGDELRLLASQQAYDYGLAFSVDATGRIEPLHVGADGRSLPLPRGRDLPLPGSRELDAYVGPEWYWLVVSERPLALAEVAETARRAVLEHMAKGGRAGDLGLPTKEGERALGFWIEKR